MSIDTLIMLAGSLVAALPFLGLPNAWDSVILMITGVVIIVLGIVVRRRGNPMFEPRTPKDTSETPRAAHEEA